jgi:alanine-glyoxylate transaminase/serine-glyoxylate transaminase/serine-pyruvate transaminase
MSLPVGAPRSRPTLITLTEVPRMAGRNHLFVPGPTNVPDRILRAMHRAMEDHRSSDFPGLAGPLFQDLRKIFKTTTGQAFIFPASGTGAWEASLSNTLSPGDKVLAARFGMFSHLWIDMAQRLGLDVEVLDAEWGEGAPIERYRDTLAADKGRKIKAVLFTHNETATGVTSDVAGMRKALNETGHPALLMVDGVSSIASIDFRMDEWGVDLAVTGSQKGLMLPAGLGIVCASQKALAQYDQAKLPRCFFDFGDMRKANATGYFPYTPSLPMLYGLRESIAMLLEEGLENVFARHKRLAAAARTAVTHWGLEVLCLNPAEYSPVLTAVLMPPGHDADQFRKVTLEKCNMSLGSGLGKVAGKVFRIGHLGECNELTLLGALSGVEMGLAAAGVPHRSGGVEAAIKSLEERSDANSPSHLKIVKN